MGFTMGFPEGTRDPFRVLPIHIGKGQEDLESEAKVLRDSVHGEKTEQEMLQNKML